MASLFIVALGWLDNTINFTEREIERLYATTVITGEVVGTGLGLGGALWGHDIPPTSLEILLDSGFIEKYFATVITEFMLFPPVPRNIAADENIHEVLQLDFIGHNFVKSINNLNTFIYEANRPTAFGEGVDEAFVLEFAPGFGVEDFNFTGGGRIPVIMHESLFTNNFLFDANIGTVFFAMDGGEDAILHQIEPGDNIYLFNNGSIIPAIIIGKYSGGHPAIVYHVGQGLVLMPSILGMNFNILTFTVEQDKVIYLREFEEEMNELLTYIIVFERMGIQVHERISHEVIIHDAEFRTVVVPLEENLHLMRVLYPIARAVSFVLALGLSLLLMLQNAKNAAILRVLGMPRYKTRFNLCMELLAVCIFGVAIGFVVVLAFGVSVATAGTLIGLYLAGAAVGTIVGGMVISQRTPMELLQVRE
jgi:hypothetical protein